MPPAKPTTVKAALAALPADRRAALAAVRDVINKHLPEGYAEGIQYGMIAWFVPHTLYPPGYHCDPKQPLPFASLASQKNHMALYLHRLYADPAEHARFADAWTAAGKKLDMGKSCVRFKKLEDVPLDVVAAAIARTPLKAYVARYEANLDAAGITHRGRQTDTGERNTTAKKATKEPAAKKATSKKITTSASMNVASKKKPASRRT